MLTKILSIGISLTYCAQLSVAAYRDDVCYTELDTELDLRGVAIPTGAGVNVTQVESPWSNGGYLPDALNSEFPTVTINDQSGSTDGLTSSHATWVGRNLYGSSTSLSPGIGNVSAYESTSFMNSGWKSGTPPTETNPLQNHSWVTWYGTTSSTLRMDYAVNRDDFLPIAGLYNSDYGEQDTQTDIPDTYGSIYNGITVGVSDGTHRYGVTSYDGAGRVKPEIVAPGRIPGSGATSDQFTSYATPMITSAAALLIESAHGDSDALKPVTLKAILLAGADKGISADWDQTATRPIDDVYGAGELDIYESYFIQQAGQQPAGSTINKRGWNLSSVSSSSSQAYSINVPTGFELRNLSALITWNRVITVSSRGPRTTYSSSLANLSLSLAGAVSQSSDSDVDNIEHIWRDSTNALATGSYTITVASASSTSTAYAIAWRSELYQDYSLWSSEVFTESTPIDQRNADDDPDGDGIKNLLEQAFGGDPEAQDLNILPLNETIEDAGERYLQISYRKPDFDNALTYTVETVSDLNGTWSSQISDVTLISIASESGGFDRYTYRAAAPISASDKAFLRVSVSE